MIIKNSKYILLNSNNQIMSNKTAWNGKCPFFDMSLTDWESYREMGQNFEKTPKWCSMSNSDFKKIQERFEYNGYIFVLQFTNNANNATYGRNSPYRNPTPIWFQMTTLVFVHKRSKMYVEFTMYEKIRDTYLDERDEPSRYEIIYHITVHYVSRSDCRLPKMSFFDDPVLHGGEFGIPEFSGSHYIKNDFFSKPESPEQDVKKILTKFFFKNIQPKKSQLFQKGDPIEKMDKITPELFYQFELLNDNDRLKILVDLFMKMNANKIVNDRFNNFNISYSYRLNYSDLPRYIPVFVGNIKYELQVGSHMVFTSFTEKFLEELEKK